MDMYYDEDLERKEDRLNQILRIPITDFELSVRARNCLNKMQITTLGDLVQQTEQELLSYKNFGETSLTEIKEILHSKGLRLGMPREEAVASIEAARAAHATGDRSDVLNKPILELAALDPRAPHGRDAGLPDGRRHHPALGRGAARHAELRRRRRCRSCAQARPSSASSSKGE